MLLCLAVAARAGFEPFEVQSVEVRGNARVSTDTVLNYVTVTPGQTIDAQTARQVLKSLYATDFFRSAALFREGNRLIIKVVERPTIADITAEGNELIKTEDLLKGLKAAGIAKGRVYNENKMKQVAQELRQRYQNMGYYGASVDLKVSELPRNRVKVVIQVQEGEPASIGRITFTGNQAYSDEQLLRRIQLRVGEQYAKEQLQGDLDRLRDYYMNRGFAQFYVRSTQVRLSPDRQKVYLTINLYEGPVYHIGKVRLAGDLKLPRKQLESLLLVHPGQRFSRKNLVDSMNALLDKYSENAYANAQVVPEPRLDRKRRIADVTFHIDPRQRVYVRRIIIEGNTRTRDHVIRRELRQLEAAPYSLEYVRLSKKRLERVGFFKKVDIQTEPVAPDLVDLHVKVEEQQTGSLTAAVGYSQLYGVTLSLGVTERNAQGSGNSVNLKIDTSGSSKQANLSIVNPYFTPNGVSLGAGFFWTQTDASNLYIGNYSLNTLGARVFSGIPLNEDDSFSYGVKLSKDELVCSSTFTPCNDFTARFGKDYLFPIFTAGWSHNSTNAFYFPTRGSRVNVSVELAPPASDAFGYAKVAVDGRRFWPMTRALTFKAAAGVKYGMGLGDLSDLPFFERFYAGGIRSVRGFEPNSLGARYNLATDGTDVAKGGDLVATGTFAIISPFPGIEDSSNLRLSFFVDYGQVFESVDTFDFDGFRVSTGVMINWITPVGPLALSFAKPLRYGDNDRLQQFQFSLGMPF